SHDETLSPFTTARPPAALISSTTCCAGVTSAPSPPALPPRSLTTTAAPSDASNSACVRPIPRPAPVTIATLPSNSPIGVTPWFEKWFERCFGRSRSRSLASNRAPSHPERREARCGSAPGEAHAEPTYVDEIERGYRVPVEPLRPVAAAVDLEAELP